MTNNIICIYQGTAYSKKIKISQGNLSFLSRLALSNAADVFPNYNSVKYQAQPSASGNYSYTITLDEDKDFKFASALTFRLNGVANSVVVNFADGTTENLAGSVRIAYGYVT